MKVPAAAWMVIAAGVGAAMHVGKLPPALPVLRSELGLSLLEAGFLLSLVQLAGMSAGVAFGVLADGFGLRRSMITGLALLVLVSAAGGAAMILSLRHATGWTLWVVTALAFVYLIAPLLIFVTTTFGSTGYLAFPPQGFTLQWYQRALSDPRYIDGFLVSLRIASIVASLSLLIGGVAAYGLVRHRMRGAALIESLLLSPLALPGLVMAVALTVFFSRHAAAAAAIGLAGTSRLILAHLVICVPCAMRVLIPAIERLDRATEEAAMNLGAGPLATIGLVTLPALRPALIAAFGFAFILSFDEVEMALFLASPREAPLTMTLYAAAQLAFDPAIAAVSALLILIVASGMIAYQLMSLRRA